MQLDETLPDEICCDMFTIKRSDFRKMNIRLIDIKWSLFDAMQLHRCLAFVRNPALNLQCSTVIMIRLLREFTRRRVNGQV